MFCPRCGREAQSGAAFCVYCGAALDAPATAPIADPSPVAADPPLTAAPPSSEAPAPAPVALRYAGFWRRFVTFLIDGVLLWIAGAIVQASFGLDPFGTGFMSDEPRGQFAESMKLMFASCVSLVIGWLYCALQESGPRQATLGQVVMGVRVTDLGHRRISFARATGRHFAQILSALILGIGYFMIAFTEKKQGLHDMLAGCLVVRATE